VVVARFQVFDGPGLRFREAEREFSAGDLGVGEVLVEISLATVCGSDVHTFEGKRAETTPCVLGHEGVGRLVALGETANAEIDSRIGDRVTWSIADSCGACPPCTTYGLPEKCERLFKYGHAPLEDGSGLNGCYASHIVLRRGTHTVRIPNSVSDATAAPANCALATMVNAVSAMPDGATRAVIQGGGLLGLYGCALLRDRGVPDVFCTEVDPRRLELIERFGGTAIDATQRDKAMDELGGRVDAVFEVAGVKELIPEGLALLRPGGFYGLVGLVHPDSALAITAEDLIRKCITLRGIHNYAPAHLRSAIAFLERKVNELPFDDLVAAPLDLSQLDQAFSRARNREEIRVSVCAPQPRP
jgi:putative phosphonate catabolism associated alcohol dehydrogenase